MTCPRITFGGPAVAPAREVAQHETCSCTTSFTKSSTRGQVWNIRDQLRLLQGWDNASLYPLLVDYYLSRAQLITALFGLTDEQLESIPPDGGWSVRQTIEHALGSDGGPSVRSETSTNRARGLARFMGYESPRRAPFGYLFVNGTRIARRTAYRAMDDRSQRFNVRLACDGDAHLTGSGFFDAARRASASR
jgi:hypothetical protein